MGTTPLLVDLSLLQSSCDPERRRMVPIAPRLSMIGARATVLRIFDITNPLDPRRILLSGARRIGAAHRKRGMYRP